MINILKYSTNLNKKGCATTKNKTAPKTDTIGALSTRPAVENIGEPTAIASPSIFIIH